MTHGWAWSRRAREIPPKAAAFFWVLPGGGRGRGWLCFAFPLVSGWKNGLPVTRRFADRPEGVDRKWPSVVLSYTIPNQRLRSSVGSVPRATKDIVELEWKK